MTSEQIEEIVEEAVARLGEHFDAVQILVSSDDHEGTGYLSRGSGNWYARVGMAREFLKRDLQTDQAIRIAEESSHEDE